MKRLTKYSLIIFTAISLQSKGQSSIPYEGKNCKGYIFDSSHFVFKTVPDQQSRFTPSKTNIDQAEEILIKRIVQANSKRENQLSGCPVIDQKLKKYCRQYVGFVNSKGERVIWINLFWNKDLIDDAAKDIIRVNDGCSYYWNVGVNIDRKLICDLQVNGNG
jgi:hypothetical protein